MGERGGEKKSVLTDMLPTPPFVWSCSWLAGIERLQVVETAIGYFCVSWIDRQQSGEAATGFVV